MATTRKKPKVHVNVTQTGKIEQHVVSDVLATEIVKISRGFQALMNEGGLNERALVLLLQDASGSTQKDIRAVLEGLASLEHRYVRKRK